MRARQRHETFMERLDISLGNVRNDWLAIAWTVARVFFTR